jgi:DNA-binding response OmpR family regulator
MRAHNTHTYGRMHSVLAGADSKGSKPMSMRSIHSSTEHRTLAGRTQQPVMLQNAMAEIKTEIDGLPVLVRLVLQDVRPETRSVRVDVADINSWLSGTLEKFVERMRGNPNRGDKSSEEPPAVVKLISSGTRLLQNQTETVLRVGALELDLIERIATRSDRPIDLRPREYQLLKYMMQRSDTLLTREALFKEVWHYNFVPETNLVDVHMGRLRRKIDGSNEAPMIRNVRGVGFILSASPLPQIAVERSTTAPRHKRTGWPSTDDDCPGLGRRCMKSQ